jgi:hypothetical protein
MIHGVGLGTQRMYGAGLRVWDVGFVMLSLGLGVEGLGFEV